MLVAAGLAAAGVLPTDCASYDVVWKYLMPLAAACFLLETDVSRLAADGGPVLVAFVIGAAGMALGAVAAWALLKGPLGDVGARLGACLCASYVGGSVNFAAVALALKVPSAALPGAMAADNLAMAGFLSVLMAVPINRAVAAVTSAATASAHPAAASAAAASTPAATGSTNPAAAATSAAASPAAADGAPTATPATAAAPSAITAESLALTLAAGSTACAVSYHIAAVLNAAPFTLLFMAGVAAAMTAAAQRLRGWAAVRAGHAPDSPEAEAKVFAGAAQLGSCLIQLFFAVLGAAAGSLSCLAGCGVLVAFLCVMVAVHWAFLFLVGRLLLRMPLEPLLLGSNANIGGAATAGAMAAAKGWAPLVQPAMVAGSMGYALGTAAGLGVARVMGVLPPL
ncbi:hypothetical protein HYH03_001798 [Edaphochlamys debaryana]|uniref:Uncharacterized protein n=1 Tax=Edaphochlamys debaryana TaxID=47281 RepID=A0A835YC55_9CHLO|nr:hypothetical protein HYH03_001798 [Edaphochlamys debaryana]|eukprot:KAG2500220.1 hypothetical protein HYH03_001798 [Edaphochlamys debaryana]